MLDASQITVLSRRIVSTVLIDCKGHELFHPDTQSATAIFNRSVASVERILTVVLQSKNDIDCGGYI